MAVIRRKSPYPIYAVGVLWVLWAIFLPMYAVLHFVILIALSAGVYALGRFVLWKDQVVTVPDPAPAPKPETEEEKALRELREERDRAVSEMRRLNDAIADPVISDQIDHLEEVTGKIFDAVAENPAKRSQIRRFLNYYLPTTLKILNAYDRMDAAGVSGANVDGTKGKIEHMMETVVSAFDKQLDGLFGAEAMDISADITVMEQMLAREGLSDQNPFAQGG